MNEPAIKILLVDDDAALLAVMDEALSGEDWAVTATPRAEEALAHLASREFDLVVTDYNLANPKIDGMAILKAIQKRTPAPLGVLITAFASLEMSVEAIRLGAYDFLVKPFQIDELQLTVRNAVERARLEKENRALRAQLGELVESFRMLSEEHNQLMNDFGRLFEHPSAAAALGAPPLPKLDHSHQVQAYVRVGETIGERLERESLRLKALFNQGLIPEPSYLKGIEERGRGPRT